MNKSLLFISEIADHLTVADGRKWLRPNPAIPKPVKGGNHVTTAQARHLYEVLRRDRITVHSPDGATLWVPVELCVALHIPYTIKSYYSGTETIGYEVEIR